MRRILRIRQAASLTAPTRQAHTSACTRQICTRLASSTSRPTATPTFRSPQSTSLRYASSKTPSANPAEPVATEQSQLEAQPTASEQQVEAQEDSFELEDDAAGWHDIETSVILPPETTTAPEPGEIIDSGYVPSETGEGLEEVGGLQGYFDGDAHWNPEHEIKRFAGEKVMDSAVLKVAARRALVEALAVRQAETGPELLGPWGLGSADIALGTQITVGEDGKAELGGDVQGIVEALASNGPVPVEHLEPGAAEELANSWGSGWKRTSLKDSELKFAITKRIYQLTGQQIRDAKLQAIYTMDDLLEVLLIKPKPAKVHDQLQLEGFMETLPNVKVWNRRVTPIDKEKATGRWRVIVEELEKRDLPVTGTGGHGKMVEKKWVMPKGPPSARLKRQKKIRDRD